MSPSNSGSLQNAGRQRLDRAFQAMRAGAAPRLIPFITAGYPDLPTTAAILQALDGLGIGICEIGVPFSDPIADGPVIASSMHEAIERGFTLAQLFRTLQHVRAHVNMALVAMSSVSLAQRRGVGEFVSACAAAGFDGVLFPDLPVEESAHAVDAAAAAGLACPMLVAPTTPPVRARKIAQASTGFVYLLARTGITGVRDETPDIGPRVAMLRSASNTPIACGFGIGSARAVSAVNEHADAAIVGSAIVAVMRQLVEQGADQKRITDDVGRFVAQLAGR